MPQVDMRKLHVLVVEDQEYVRHVITEILKEKGTGLVSAARDGYEALRALRQAEQKVDVILLDLEMPRLNGFDFIKKLRDDSSSLISKTPVVVITGLSHREALDRVGELGVKLFLIKPITADQVITRINAAMR